MTDNTTQPSTVRPSVFSKLVYNRDFDQENRIVDPLDSTVVYSSQAKGETAEWLKIKRQLEAEMPKLVQHKHPSTCSIRPKLINENNDDGEGNDTWDEMKKQYDISDDELYGDSTIPLSVGKIDQGDTLSEYSFQDDNLLRFVSDKTTKVTSWKYGSIDSPMPMPRLIKRATTPISKQDSTIPRIIKELRLITPLDEGMIFDRRSEKWVYPNHELPSIDDSRDLRQIKKASQLDLSFLESRKKLGSFLEDIIGGRCDWDAVKTLSLQGKQLISVKGLKESLPSLESLDLGHNKLINLEGVPYSIQILILSHNNLTDPMLNFERFINLQRLDLSHNSIKRLDPFQDLKNLRELKLRDCHITELVDLPLIQKLDLSNNDIGGCVNFSTLRFDCLIDLNLSGNRIASVNLASECNLRILNLEKNRLESVDFSVPLPQLKKLLLQSNMSLKKMTIGSYLKNIRILSLDSKCAIDGKLNKLEQLSVLGDGRRSKQLFDNDQLKLNGHLTTVILHHCGITLTDLTALQSKFPHLSKFDLCDNAINCSFVEIMELMQRFGPISKLRLEGNPLLCGLSEEDKEIYKLMIYKLTH
jgi:Leucine-rich repeat (LRR) protein